MTYTDIYAEHGDTVLKKNFRTVVTTHYLDFNDKQRFTESPSVIHGDNCLRVKTEAGKLSIPWHRVLLVVTEERPI